MKQRIVTTMTVGLAVALAAVITLGTHADGRVFSKPAKGRFLIASPRLHDPNFTRTVVLLTDYSEKGAMGLVINRPTEVSISHAVPELADLSRSDDKVSIGGPVRRHELFVLLQSADEPEESHHVFDDVYLTGSGKMLEKIVDGDGTFRVFAGYSGWGAGQLDAELARGDWLIKSADAETIFNDDPQQRYRVPADPTWSAKLHAQEGSGLALLHWTTEPALDHTRPM